MRQIEDLLVIGIGVDGGHEALDDLELIVGDFDCRGQTVGGAGGVRDDIMLLGIVFIFVDAEHDGQIFALCRSGDNDFLRAAFGDVVDGALDGLALLIDAVFLDGEQTGRTRSRCRHPGCSTGC